MLSYLRKSRTVLGKNRRNIDYVKASFFDTGHHILDDKLKTKKLLRKAGIPVPKTYKIIKDRKDLALCNWQKFPNSFVVKPNLGTMGRGILIAFGKKKNKTFNLLSKNKTWVQADGKSLPISDLESHIAKILEGVYSYSITTSDIAFFEERLKLHPLLKPYCQKGIPDIRIISYKKIPVMAELRLPTSTSAGLSNLTRGGIGIGLDIGSGTTTSYGVWNKRLINQLPGVKKLPLSGIKVPFWKEILELSVKTQKILKIDYIGLDIAIDRDRGPVVVEVNTRPGLGIQTANLAPLRERLERIGNIKVRTINQGVRLARDMFGGEIEEELEGISGKKVIGITEPIEVLDSKNKKHFFIAKIDTGTLKTQIRKDLFETLKLKENEKKSAISISFVMSGVSIETEAVVINDLKTKYELIIGRKDLKKFLIDPAKIYLRSKKILRKKI